MIQALARRNEALEALNQGDSRFRAVGKAALAIVEQGRGHDHTPYLQLLGSLPNFIETQHHLDTLRAQRQTRSNEFREAKVRVIQFNHHLREVVDTNPNESVSAIARFATEATLALVSPREAAYVNQQVTSALEGMRHEIALEGVLYHIKGVEEVRNATTEEELKGVDIVVNYKGMSMDLDVKASQKSAQEKAVNQLSHGNPAIPIWSGFNRSDFGDKLRITDQEMNQEIAGDVENILEEAYLRGTSSALNMVAKMG